ncbi:RNA polymerase sigma-70 factor [Chitinophaga sp. MM2321]|uniref:RNA polymerase sigma factor n=1 Tax=Chitinophaga sp. MM2321 TaxID=3137178 RepID=UPI0032D5A4E5
MHSSPYSEKELLSRIAAGDEEAYQLIFERHWDAVFSTALLLTKSPEVAEDIAQDIFVMLWEKRAQLTAIEKLEGFLFISARNMIYSRLRKLASEDAYQQYLRAYFKENSIPGGDERAEFREMEQTIHKAIRRLPPQQQKAFRLSRFEGMRHEEIAAMMGVSRITIKSYIVQALASLRKIDSIYYITVLLSLITTVSK